MAGRVKKGQQAGFTLMELVLVVVLLGIVATATMKFVQFGVETYLDSASRQNMASSGRFVTERLSRELRNALPGSVNLRPDLLGAGNCIEFRPVDWTFAYLADSAPIQPTPAANSITVVSTLAENTDYQIPAGTLAVIYPLDTTHVYAGGGRAAEVSADTYTVANDHTVTLNFTGAAQFAAASPAKRLYLTSSVITYCHSAGELYRFSTGRFANGAAPDVNTGVLMGRWFNNQANEPMFSLGQSAYSGNALIRLMFRLTERDEEVVLNHEVHLLQAP